MIAVLEVPWNGKKVVAGLKNDGTWLSPDAPALAQLLRMKYDPRGRRGPQFGDFGAYEVEKASKEMKAKVLEFKRPKPDPKVVY